MTGTTAPPWVVLSPSRRRDFEVCPRQYRNRYILQLPRQRLDTEHQRDGLAVHEELRARHDQPRRHDDDAMLVEDVIPSPRVAEAVRRHRAICPRDAAAYVGGELELFWLLRRDRILLSGRVDAMWQYEDGTLEVRDYKSGGRGEGPDETFAVQMYALLAAARRPRPRAIRVVIERLGGDERPPTIIVADRDYLAAALARVKEVSVRLRDERDFAATPSPAACGSCGFQRLCPAAS